MEKVFLYRVKNGNDRDCVSYIDNKPLRFECNHYFGNIILHGSCYSNNEFKDYDDIETVLTKEEYNKLLDFNSKINDLGYRITKGDEKYQIGVKLCEEIQSIYDKLNSQENKEFFDKIAKEEMEYLKEEYDFSDEDIEEILDNYDLEYKDRSIVGCVYKDTYELGYEEAYFTGVISSTSEWNLQLMEKFFDFEEFGNFIIENDTYVELSDGRIVSLNY